MNTPAHVVVGLWVLGRGARRDAAWAIAAGGLLPDAPMLLFYALEKLRQVPEATIWSQHYFDPAWQSFFDLFNSLPLIALGLTACWLTGRRRAALFLGAMGIHALTDLPLHHDDGHRHFYPLSSWRFESPISYWDPERFGAWTSLAEVVLVAVGLVVLWRRYPTRALRALLLGIAFFYVAYLGYVLVVWV